jgi:hypothetical protein
MFEIITDLHAVDGKHLISYVLILDVAGLLSVFVILVQVRVEQFWHKCYRWIYPEYQCGC